VLGDLFRPWRSRRLWPALCHVVLDLPLGIIEFTVVFTLLVTAASLVIVFPLAIPVAWLFFVLSAGLGRLERGRVGALLKIDIASPHAPLPDASWWRRLVARVGSASRWREIAYMLAMLPVGVLGFVLAAVAWCGSLALLGLPFYVKSLPGNTAKFGLFEIGTGGGAIAAGLIGLAGVVIVAPWLTTALAGFDGWLARALLAPRRHDELAARVAQLDLSRAAAVDSAEAERRRIERDLHDGAQARLVALGMDLGRAREQFDTDPERARALVEGAHEEAKAALSDLRELVRGVHPAILDDRGLDAALSSVVARAPVPVALHVDVEQRPPASIESTAYFVVSEALANVAKHAHATRASVTIVRAGDRLVVEVSDDGVGGADQGNGTGLRGLSERLTAVGGWMQVLSPAGGPTTLLAELPCGS
jgi:signal transduction histidine kinase